MQHYGSVVTSTRSVKKKVRVSKELACQLQIILTDAEDHNVYEEVFEKWDEPMSSLSYRGCDSDDNEEEEQADSSKKLTPLLNPDFNKPINIAESIEPKAIEKPKAQINKPLPKIIPLLQVDEPKEYVPAEPKKITGFKRLLSIGSSSSTTNKKKSDLVEKDDKQFHVLRIFSGNINVGAMFNTVAVTPEMNADQLLKLALQKFHIPLLEESATSKRPTSLQNGIEYYLTVKSMDGGTLQKTKKIMMYRYIKWHAFFLFF